MVLNRLIENYDKCSAYVQGNKLLKKYMYKKVSRINHLN